MKRDREWVWLDCPRHEREVESGRERVTGSVGKMALTEVIVSEPLAF